MAVKNISDLQVVKAVAEYWSGGRAEWPYSILQRETGECFKVCYRALERAYRHGLTCYGVSLRTAWLTEKGIDLLNKHKPLESKQSEHDRPNTDGVHWKDVLKELSHCAGQWEPEVRLLGNVRSVDIVVAIAQAIRLNEELAEYKFMYEGLCK